MRAFSLIIPLLMILLPRDCSFVSLTLCLPQLT